MGIDAAALGRAARLVDAAVAAADHARTRAVPRMFGRGEALDDVASSLDAAHAQAGSAAAELRDGSGPVADAHTAITELGTALSTVRRAKNVDEARRGPELLSRLDAARGVPDALREHAGFLEWVDATASPDAASAAFDALVGSPSEPLAATQVASLLERHGRHLLPNADRAWVNDVAQRLTAEPSPHGTAVLLDALRTAHTHSSQDVSVAFAEALVNHADPDGAVRRLAALASLPEGMAPPALEPHRTRLLAAAQQHDPIGNAHVLWDVALDGMQSEDVVANRALAQRSLDALLALPTQGIDRERIMRFVDLAGLPADVSPELPPTLGTLGSLAEWSNPSGPFLLSDIQRKNLVDADIWVRARRLDDDPTVTDESLVQRLDSILNKDDADITTDDIRTLAALDQMTGPHRLDLPTFRYQSHDLSALARNGWTPSNGMGHYVKPHLGTLRYWQAARTIHADPSVTRATLLDELGSILAKEDNAITHEDLLRIGVLDRLGDAKRIPLSPDGDGNPWLTAVIENWSGTRPAAKAELAKLRGWYEVLRIDVDPTMTRASLLDELGTILAKEPDAITLEDVRRIAAFEQLDDGKRLSMPAPLNGRSRSVFVQQHWSAPSHPERVGPELAHLRMWHDVQRLNADDAVTRGKLLDELGTILAKDDSQITSTDMRRIALFDQVDPGKRLELPAPVVPKEDRQTLARNGAPSNTPGYASRELANLRMWHEARRLEADSSVTRETLLAELDTILAKPDPEVTTADVARIATFDLLGDAKHLALPAIGDRHTMATHGWLPANHAYARDVRSELTNLRLWREARRLDADPSVTRESTLAELGSILAKPDADITADDMLRIALLEHTGVAPSLNLPTNVGDYTRQSMALWGWTPATHARYVTPELASLRLWHEARLLDADPTATRETLSAELATILAKPNSEITADDMRRLALLDQLDDAKRIDLPPQVGDDRRTLALAGWTPRAHARYVTPELANLRHWHEARALDEDPAVTRDTLMREISDILAKPDELITTDDMRRIVTFELLDGDKRLGLPGTAADRRNLVTTGWLPGATPMQVRSDLKQLRLWLYTSSPAGLAQFRTRLVAGEPVDQEVLDAVAGIPLDRLAAAGIEMDHLFAESLSKLTGTGGLATALIGARVQTARTLLGRLDTSSDPMQALLASDIDALLESNIGRAGGTVRDGYSTHPEYAQLGSIIAKGRLLLGVREATRVQPVVDATTDGVTQLVW